MKEKHLLVKKTARYYTLGELNENTQNVWFVLHGYGQLVHYFIKKFEILDNGTNFIVAPEALSKFYLNGVSGRVGATWMTKEDRASEITDYVNYLNQLYDALFVDENHKNIKINVLAFSQGNATAMRWLNNASFKCSKLILWAAYFGNGVKDVIEPSKLETIETHFVYGNQDEYLIQIDMEDYRNRILSEIPNLKITEFEGKHTIDVPTLKALLAL